MLTMYMKSCSWLPVTICWQWRPLRLLQHTASVKAAALSLHLIMPVNFSSKGCVPTQIMSADANRGLILVTCTAGLVRPCNSID